MLKTELTVAPAATVTEAGGVIAALFEDRVTTAPPTGAGELSVTVLFPKLSPPRIPPPPNFSVTVLAAFTVIVAVCEVLLALAVIVDDELVATARVVTVNVAVVEPAATVTEAGTVAAAVVLELRLTVRPPVGATELIVTVPVEVPAPVTDVGFNESAVTVGAVIARLAVVLTPANVAVIVAEAFAATAVVVTLNVAEVDPAGTVTVAGTVAEALFDASAMEIPPVGAAALIVTVPTEATPPTTLVGLRVTLLTLSGLTVSVAVLLAPPRVAVTVAVAEEPTTLVVTVKVPVVAPAATVTVAGTDAAALFDASVTDVPPVGAGPERVTVPVELARPPTTDVGLRATELRVAAVTFSVAVTLVVPVVPVRVTAVLLATPAVVIANVAVVVPAGTTTDAGTVTAALFDASVTVVPPVGALAYSVTVPVEPDPPRTVVGLTERAVTTGGTTAIAAVELPPL